MGLLPQDGRSVAPAGLIGIVGDPHAEDGLLDQALQLLAGHSPDVLLCTGDVVDGAGDLGRTVRLLRGAGVVTVRGNHDRWLLGGELRDLSDAHQLADLDADVRAWLAGLPATVRLPVVLPGARVDDGGDDGGSAGARAVGELLLCHGLDDDDMNRLRTDDHGYSLEQNAVLLGLLGGAGPPAVVVKGHTHRPGVARFGLGTAPWGAPVPRAGGGLLVVDAGTLRREHSPSCSLLDLPGGTLTRFDLATGQEHVAPLPADPGT